MLLTQTAERQLTLARRHGGIGTTAAFLHIGKTAGTTVARVISHRFKPPILALDAPSEVAMARELGRLSQSQRDRLTLIHGHFLYGLHSYLAQPVSYFTFLRDPWARLRSAYRHVRDRAGHPLHDLVVKERMSLVDFVTSGITLETDNWQVRCIAGDDATQFGRCDMSVLERAKANIARDFDMIGLSEEFDLSLAILARLHGWTRVYYFPENRSESFAPRGIPDDLPNVAPEAVRRHIEYDQRLYEYCAEIISVIHKRLPEIDRDVQRIRWMNRLYYPVGRLRHPISVWREHRRQSLLSEGGRWASSRSGIAVDPGEHGSRRR